MPFSPQTLGRRLRCILRHFHLALDPDGHVYPGTCAALGALEAALDAEMPPWAALVAKPCVGAVQRVGGPFFVAAVLHIHDEASLRLR